MNAEENKMTHAPKTEHTPNTAHAQPTHTGVAAVADEVKAETKAETKTASATPAKKETKTSAKASKAKAPAPVKTSNKPAKKKGKKDVWVKKEKVKKDAQAKKTQEELLKKWKPTFWGRFGKKNLRTRKNPKYDKWRKPRGEDMQQRKDDGAVVAAGYRTPKAFRGFHPSGYEEVYIHSARDLNNVKPSQVARFAGTIGRKKKIALIKIANEKKIRMLN